MAKHAGFARWVYNWGLRLWSEGYKEGIKPSANTLKKLFTNHVKPQFSWMSELSSKVYQYAFIALGDAFKRFFTELGGYPNFKRKGFHDRFSIDNSGKPIKVGGLRHKLPFIGWVRTHEALPDCVTKKVTISKHAGDWYLSFHVEIPDIEFTPKAVDLVGVDLAMIDRDLNAAINLCNWGRLVPGSLQRDNRSHAPEDAESKPQCRDLSDVASVL